MTFHHLFYFSHDKCSQKPRILGKEFTNAMQNHKFLSLETNTFIRMENLKAIFKPICVYIKPQNDMSKVHVSNCKREIRINGISCNWWTESLAYRNNFNHWFTRMPTTRNRQIFTLCPIPIPILSLHPSGMRIGNNLTSKYTHPMHAKNLIKVYQHCSILSKFKFCLMWFVFMHDDYLCGELCIPLWKMQNEEFLVRLFSQTFCLAGNVCNMILFHKDFNWHFKKFCGLKGFFVCNLLKFIDQNNGMA